MDSASSLQPHEATERRREVVNSVRASFLFYKNSERRGLSPLSPAPASHTIGAHHLTHITAACGLAKTTNRRDVPLASAIHDTGAALQPRRKPPTSAKPTKQSLAPAPAARPNFAAWAVCRW